MRGVVLALSIAIAVLATMLALEPMLLPPKTVTVTATKSFEVTKLVPTTITTVKTLTSTETLTTTITKPITKVVTTVITTAIPTTITKPITYTLTTTIENEKTVTTTKVVTTTKRIVETKTLTKTTTETITTTIIKNETIVKSIVLESINCGKVACHINKTVAKEIYKWLTKANHSIYAMLKGVVGFGGAIGEALAKAFENLSKKGVKIVVVAEVISVNDIFDFNISVAKEVCKYVEGEMLYPAFLDDAIVVDGKIVIWIGLTHVEIVYSPEIAKNMIEEVKLITTVNHGKPAYCIALEQKG